MRIKTKKSLKSSLAALLGIGLLFISSCDKGDGNEPFGTVTDVDGNVYGTVKIGTQTWMKENLRVTSYNNGDPIETIDIKLDVGVNPKFQWVYSDDESNANPYGRLYTWYAAADPRKVCPAGWHLPSNSEWQTLIDFVGGEEVAGGKLKEVGSDRWLGTNEGATDQFGFSAVPGGLVDTEDRLYIDLGYYSYWWTSTESIGTDYVYSWDVNYDGAEASVGEYFHKSIGLCIRCITD